MQMENKDKIYLIWDKQHEFYHILARDGIKTHRFECPSFSCALMKTETLENAHAVFDRF